MAEEILTTRTYFKIYGISAFYDDVAELTEWNWDYSYLVQ